MTDLLFTAVLCALLSAAFVGVCWIRLLAERRRHENHIKSRRPERGSQKNESAASEHSRLGCR